MKKFNQVTMNGKTNNRISKEYSGTAMDLLKEVFVVVDWPCLMQVNNLNSTLQKIARSKANLESTEELIRGGALTSSKDVLEYQWQIKAD